MLASSTNGARQEAKREMWCCFCFSQLQHNLKSADSDTTRTTPRRPPTPDQSPFLGADHRHRSAAISPAGAPLHGGRPAAATGQHDGPEAGGPYPFCLPRPRVQQHPPATCSAPPRTLAARIAPHHSIISIITRWRATALPPQGSPRHEPSCPPIGRRGPGGGLCPPCWPGSCGGGGGGAEVRER